MPVTRSRSRRENGQGLVGFAVIAGIVASFTAMIYQQASIKSFDNSQRQFESSIARSAFEKAAKQLRFLYQNNAACDPAAFAQAVMSLPNPASMANSLVASQNCDLNAASATGTTSPSCRAIEIISPNEAAYFSGLYVFVGAVIFNRIDPCTRPGNRVNDLNPAAAVCTTDTNIPQGGVGVHLRAVVNDTKYEQWIAFVDTCSTQSLPSTNNPGGAGAGAGLGTGWILGSSHIPLDPVTLALVGVSPPDLACPYGAGAVANNFGRVNMTNNAAPDWRFDLLTARRLMSLIQSPIDTSEDYRNPECLDANQDGVTDERDLNLYEKYLTGWIPHIPVRGR